MIPKFEPSNHRYARCNSVQLPDSNHEQTTENYMDVNCTFDESGIVSGSDSVLKKNEDLYQVKLSSNDRMSSTVSWTGGLSQGCTTLFHAPSTVSLTNPGGVGTSLGTVVTPNGTPRTKLESLKNWTIAAYKCSRQSIYEKLGKSSRTVDSELETQIERLRETQRKYSNILKLARALTNHFYHVVQTQNNLAESMNELALKSPELQREFTINADVQRNLCKNGEVLIASLNYFVSSVNTLCNKTMDDTMATIKLYENARIEYDAYRCDLDFYSSAPKSANNDLKLREVEETFNSRKGEFEKLRADVQVKLKFLDENRVNVMHKQLMAFNEAVCSYFKGNRISLDPSITQLNNSENSH